MIYSKLEPRLIMQVLNDYLQQNEIQGQLSEKSWKLTYRVTKQVENENDSDNEEEEKKFEYHAAVRAEILSATIDTNTDQAEDDDEIEFPTYCLELRHVTGGASSYALFCDHITTLKNELTVVKDTSD